MKPTDSSVTLHPPPADLAALVTDECNARIAHTSAPFRLGISGLPGCGKSTLAAAIVAAAKQRGWPALALSLDDFYLPRGDRRKLARRVHPLLATRGVPGTHDLDLLLSVLQQLPQASRRHPVAIPRFDKGRDTRMPHSRWHHVDSPPRLLILEGWCLGVSAQQPAQLIKPVNALEQDEDADGRWRAWVNQRLREYAPIWKKLDARVVLQAPDWTTVCRWREQAEQSLRARRAPKAMDAPTLQRFLQHYERIGRHALEQTPAPADHVFYLDASRHPGIV